MFTSNKSDNELQSTLQSLIKGIVSIYPEKFLFNMSIYEMSAYFLCYCSVSSAYCLITHLLQHVIPAIVYDAEEY
jgi:hypothetical protein